MKKSLLLVVLILIVFSAYVFAASKLTRDTNIAIGKKAFGTFSDASLVLDSKADTKKFSVSSSGNVSSTPQFITIDLGDNQYVDRVKVYWDLSAYPKDYEIRTSSDGKYWVVEAENLDAASGAKDSGKGFIATTVSCKKAMIGARYVQIYVPTGAKVTGGNSVKLAEIEVFPAVGQSMNIKEKDAYVVTDTMAVIKYKTSIGSSKGFVLYGKSPKELSKVAPNQENGVVNSATIYGLNPQEGYYYKIQVEDIYGNKVVSDAKRFETLNENVAFGKPVSGTFTELPPRDKYVSRSGDVISRITDGSTSYFTSMATSRSLSDADQVATIDLGKVYSLKNIISYWRKLAYPEDFTVMVSEDGKSWSTVKRGLNAGDGAFSRSDAGDPMVVLNTPASGKKARYIQIFIPKGSAFFHKHDEWNFVQLMEVKVFAD